MILFNTTFSCCGKEIKYTIRTYYHKKRNYDFTALLKNKSYYPKLDIENTTFLLTKNRYRL